MGRTPDAVIVGAGIVGCSIAYDLARAGHRVVVLDAARGPGQGSTSASSACVRFNYSTLTGVVTAWESVHRWQAWEDYIGGTDERGLARFHRTGGVHLEAPTQPTSVVLDLFDRAGVPYERLTAEQIRARFPALDTGRHYPPKAVDDEAFFQDPQDQVDGYYTPDAGYVDDPSLATHNLMVAAERHGAQFRFGSPVLEVRRSGDRVQGVTLGDGTRIDAAVVVNAAGPHSGRVNELAGAGDDFAVRTRPLQQEVHELPGRGGYTKGPFVSDLDLGTYFRSTPAGNVLVGGTEPECDPLVWLDRPEDAATTPSAAVYEAQAYGLARRVPAVAVPGTPRGIVGVYDVSTDWVPIYDRTSVGGYYVAIGTSGNQFKNGPVVGQLMAALISACEDGHDHDRDPVQVRLGATGQVADLSHYSRLRTPSVTSQGVMG